MLHVLVVNIFVSFVEADYVLFETKPITILVIRNKIITISLLPTPFKIEARLPSFPLSRMLFCSC